MSNRSFLWAAVAGLCLLCSCGNAGNKVAENRRDNNRIVQQADGTISLKLEKADCYNDKVDPSGNTAEWDVVVSKSGRYDVWLSSATKDTTDLKYKHPVLVSIQDNRLEGHPANCKIIHNSTDVSYPYFRADSFMGSMYIQDTGEFNIQVICEKILPDNNNQGTVAGEDLSKLISVSFTPATR
ncbi:MAG: hypothetical protein ABSA76_08085 [Bacteroidales bacterium]